MSNKVIYILDSVRYVLEELKVLGMGPLRFSKDDIDVNFARPFQPSDNIVLTNCWKGFVNVIFKKSLYCYAFGGVGSGNTNRFALGILKIDL